LPGNLKSGIEHLSGIDVSDVKVHYNSSQPAQLHAHAYTQGNQIHVAPGQEKHLSHETWHVVQQKQGRVKPTFQMKGKVNVNNNAGLKKEVGVMGVRALQMKPDYRHRVINYSYASSRPVIQRAGWGDRLYNAASYVGSTRVGRFTSGVAGAAATVVGGVAGGVTGAIGGGVRMGISTGSLSEAYRGARAGAIAGAQEGAERPMTAVGTLAGAALASTVASPLTLGGAVLAGVAGTVGYGLGRRSDRAYRLDVADVAEHATGAYPADSIGTFNRPMARRTRHVFGEQRREISGAQLQRRIINLLKNADGPNTGGYRLGTFLFTPPKSFQRTPDPHVERHGMTMLPSTFDVGSIDPLIVPLITGTLRDAGQIAYLVRNWDEISQTHLIIVDVDCQYDRRGNVGFHKDSRGHTVFFNLTYSNEESMQGPDAYQDHRGVAAHERNLPRVVQEDIATRRDRERTAGDTTIHSDRLPRFGRVSLSDANLFHTTPRLGHRLQPPRAYNRATMIDQLVQTYDSIGRRGLRRHFDTMSDDELRGHADPYSTHNTEAESKRGEQEAMVMTSARRRRALSVDLNEGRITQEALDREAAIPRTFIRTWVRMIPRP
jgi:hypothetical protein